MYNIKVKFLFFAFLLVRFSAYSGVPVEGDLDLKFQERSHTAGIPNLYAILIICDDYVSSENNAISGSVRVDMANVTQMLDLLQNRNIANVKKTLLQGRKATQLAINQTISAIKPEADDIVLVYFSGHGWMEGGKSYLLTADEKSVSRNILESNLRMKTGRLKILLTDACSNDVEVMAVARSISRAAKDAQEGKYDAYYKSLFWNYEGTMHLSASSDGEYAWSDDYYGGYFTYYFVKEGIIKNPSMRWEDVFKGAKDKTLQAFNRIPATERSTLAKSGIKSQTPKSYAMPSLKKGTTAATTPTKTTPTATPTATKPSNCQGSILIRNASGKPISVTLDYNKDNETWKASNTEPKTIAANTTLTLNKCQVVIGFNSGKEKILYDLEAGKYSFEKSGASAVNLYSDNSKKRSITATDYSDEVLGTWKWEDEDGNAVVTKLNTDGTFRDDYATEFYSGSWGINMLSIRGKQTPVLSFSSEEEGGSVIQYDYTMRLDDDGETMQLIFYGLQRDGKPVSNAEASKYTGSALVLYKK